MASMVTTVFKLANVPTKTLLVITSRDAFAKMVRLKNDSNNFNLNYHLSFPKGFAGDDCEMLLTKSSAQIASSSSGAATSFIIVFVLIICVALGFVTIYYRRRFKQLKDSLCVEYNNYYNSSEPRHFDNPVYSTGNTMPTNNTKLLNNFNNSPGHLAKNTNLLKSKIFNDFDCDKMDPSDLYEVPNSNLYVEVDEDKISKASNFYHTIDELDANRKAKSLNVDNCK